MAAYPLTIRSEALVVQGGLLYSFGGNTGSGGTANAYVYNPAVNLWTAIAPLPAIRDGASAVSDGTYIYILNGFGPGGSTTDSLYRYDPATNSYTTLASRPAPRPCMGRPCWAARFTASAAACRTARHRQHGRRLRYHLRYLGGDGQHRFVPDGDLRDGPRHRWRVPLWRGRGQCQCH